MKDLALINETLLDEVSARARQSECLRMNFNFQKVWFLKQYLSQWQQCSSNSGAAVSRNTALRSAKGRWIAFLDSDNLWEPTKLEKQIRFMEENNYVFSYHEYIEIDEDDKELGECQRDRSLASA